MPKMPKNKFFVCQAKINLVIRVAFLSQAVTSILIIPAGEQIEKVALFLDQFCRMYSRPSVFGLSRGSRGHQGPQNEWIQYKTRVFEGR